MIYLAVAFSVLCIGILICVIAESCKENKSFAVSDYELYDDRVRKKVKIVFISDLHNARYGEDNEELISRIDELEPDLILSAGDLIIGKPGKTVDIAVNLLNTLGERYPVYIGKGNHEMRVSAYEEYGDMWEKLYESTKDKVTWLINDSIYLDEYNIKIFGLDMKPFYYRRFVKPCMSSFYLPALLGSTSEKEYDILLGHDPDYFDDYSRWGADLTLSGHVHGGLVILPKIGGVVSPMVRLFPKYYKGVYVNDGKTMIVSAGLGLHTLKIRVNNYPDLVSVTISNKNS